MIKISVVIPTYNQCELLETVYNSLELQSINERLFEIIIVDNNSTDKTKTVCEQLIKSSSINSRYVFEITQGLHNARNRGILEAKGEIIVFFDDDIKVDKECLIHIYNEFTENDKAGVVGGKVLPLWQSKPPDWIYDYGSNRTHGVFAYLDNGDKRKVLNDFMIWGCNFAIRKELALEIGGSPPDTFPKNLKYLSGMGETAMIKDVMRLGYEIVYLPNAYVYHHICESRMKIDYFIDRFERKSIEEVYDVFRNEKNRLKASLILLKKALNIFVCYRRQSKDKKNPDYFKIIERKRALALIMQTLRVLFSARLYRFINKNNYMDRAPYSNN